MSRTMREAFEEIHARDAWAGGGSGEGSRLAHNRGYVAFLQAFLARRRIASVVDLGCGDWQFSRTLDWRGIEYKGFDLVAPLIERNRRLFARPGLSFDLFDGDFAGLPAAGLLIAKDVLQHWSLGSIAAFLPHLSRFGCSLITNCVDPAGATANGDIPDGAFRPLDLRLPPFSLAAVEVYRFSNHRPWWRPFQRPAWTKSVLLIDGSGAASGTG
jgi:SAM-dependent methyltransferase